MTPERAKRIEAILRAVVASLRGLAEEAEEIDALQPGIARHLIASIEHARITLEQLLEWDEERE
jgi:hypothetical protein